MVIAMGVSLHGPGLTIMRRRAVNIAGVVGGASKPAPTMPTCVAHARHPMPKLFAQQILCRRIGMRAGGGSVRLRSKASDRPVTEVRPARAHEKADTPFASPTCCAGFPCPMTLQEIMA